MGTKILIVDDEPDIILLLKNRLEAMQYQVVMAQNGAEALKIFQRDKPDLIITDVMMPGLTGYEFFEALRKMGGEGASVPVIVTSARRSMAQFFDKWAIDCFIPKPFDLSAFMQAIERALAAKNRAHVLTEKHLAAQQKSDLQDVLLVGVSEYELRKVKEFLESQQCLVHQGLDEQDSLEIAQKIRPDYIFMEFWEDARRFDTVKFFRDLSKSPKTDRIPRIVFCSPSLQIEASKTFSPKHLLVFRDVAELLNKLASLVQAPEFRKRNN